MGHTSAPSLGDDIVPKRTVETLVIAGLALACAAGAALAFAAPAFILKWGSAGTAAGQFQFPHGLATGPGGVVYVSDAINRRVQRFSGVGATQTSWPTGGDCAALATDASGNVYVAVGHGVKMYS